MFQPYIDLHMHTSLSDGVLRPQQLADHARAAGLRIVAITDHNHTEDLTALRAANPDMTFIQGTEISCRYTQSDGSDVEIHVVGLGFDPQSGEIRDVLKRNRPDRRPYINAILGKLRALGIDLGSYEELRAQAPDTRHLGRMQIAKTMVERGFVSSVDEAFDRYIGAFGERLAFAPNPLRYVSMEEAVAAIRSAGGVAVLAHLFYYQLEEEENLRLVRYFKELAGPDGAMEVYYGRYTPEQRLVLLELADQFGLMYSAASDFHGQSEQERLDNRFSHACCAELLSRLGAAIQEPHANVPIIVLGGFSGSGKGALLRRIPADFTIDGRKHTVITSFTTRESRGSSDNYAFVSKEVFERMADADAFLEYNAAYSDHSYGTPKKDVLETFQRGRIPLLEIDQTGLIRLLTEGRVNPKQIRRIFIVATSRMLLQRLRGRGSENAATLRKRLCTAGREAPMVCRLYRSVIDNDVIEVAARKLLSALRGEIVRDHFSERDFQTELAEVIRSLTE